MSKTTDGAERKGREAALAGKGEDACPYHDRRTMHGAVTWSRACIRAWLEGHRKQIKEMQ